VLVNSNQKNPTQIKEDSTFSDLPDPFRLFLTQSANNPSPKQQKQPKPSLSKMQQQLFFYHTTKTLRVF
jgi:hypothetical protein